METPTLTTPEKASIKQLEALQRRYAKPQNSMETFILAGIHAELKSRELEHLKIRGIAPEYAEDLPERDRFDTSEEFQDILDNN